MCHVSLVTDLDIAEHSLEVVLLGAERQVIEDIFVHVLDVRVRQIDTSGPAHTRVVT